MQCGHLGVYSVAFGGKCTLRVFAIIWCGYLGQFTVRMFGTICSVGSCNVNFTVWLLGMTGTNYLQYLDILQSWYVEQLIVDTWHYLQCGYMDQTAVCILSIWDGPRC